jgi:hypothetical protein
VVIVARAAGRRQGPGAAIHRADAQIMRWEPSPCANVSRSVREKQAAGAPMFAQLWTAPFSRLMVASTAMLALLAIATLVVFLDLP